MNPAARKQDSKFLSFVLRHKPEAIGIELDAAGWVEVDVLLDACARHGRPISIDALREIVSTNDKQRFALDEDGAMIRASQGHSVPVELGYERKTPPETLYHGTPERFVAPILEQGLKRGARHHVHLSKDVETATKVGQRRGRPVILRVRAGEMDRAGHPFFFSANGVWLTEHVPPQYIEAR